MLDFNIEYSRWLKSDSLTDREKKELISIKDNPEEIEFSFSSMMDFGTAGLRSTMKLGTRSMNRFTVAHTTRALADLILESGGADRGAVVCYDSRNNSESFARTAASILAGANVKVYIFDNLRPTPELSFAVRKLNAIAGINITASHNPKEYNGYKAYWEDGAQIGPEQADRVSKTREKYDVLDLSGMVDFDSAVESGIITVLDEQFDEQYLEEVKKTAVDKEIIADVAETLSVVYTPLHGTGYRLIPRLFSEIGLKHLYTVDAQMTPDGDFPTVKKPNPEYAEVFKLGTEIADRVGSDLVIATDPDADRVGVMTRDNTGKFITLTGNQMGALLLDYAIKRRKEKGILPTNAYCVKSIVSTDMAYSIASYHGIKLHDVLTGFKYIGETIKKYEDSGINDAFILGFEESYGYLLGSYARDKDAVEASMIILEMTAYYKKLGMTLADAMESLYGIYGRYAEKMIDIYMEGLDGIAKRREVTAKLRATPPREIGGVRISKIGDYLSGETVNLSDGTVTKIDQPKSDVIYYTLENGDKIIIRPSGTEPKIKIYILSHGESTEAISAKNERYEIDARRLANV